MPQIGWLNATEMNSFTILKARHLKSRCWKGHALSATPGGCQHPWCFLACSCIIPISASCGHMVIFPVCLRTSHDLLPPMCILLLSPILLLQGHQSWIKGLPYSLYDLILIYIKISFSNMVTFTNPMG